METEILENVKKHIIEYDSKETVNWVRKAVAEEIDPVKVLNALTLAIRQVGDRFGRGDLWLPELIGAASALQAAMPIVEEELKKRRANPDVLGTIVIGTVYGDIHTIGKDIVSTLLTAEGFKVIDLGVNVAADQFAEAVMKHQADILAMSALLTMTAAEQRKVIDLLGESGIRGRVKVLVGGGAVNEKFAESIGADGYDATAVGGAKLARRLMGVK